MNPYEIKEEFTGTWEIVEKTLPRKTVVYYPNDKKELLEKLNTFILVYGGSFKGLSARSKTYKKICKARKGEVVQFKHKGKVYQVKQNWKNYGYSGGCYSFTVLNYKTRVKKFIPSKEKVKKTLIRRNFSFPVPINTAQALTYYNNLRSEEKEFLIKDQVEKLKKLGYKFTPEGDLIGYKTFGYYKPPQKEWSLTPGYTIYADSILFDGRDCGAGVNFCPNVTKVKRNFANKNQDIWEIKVKRENLGLIGYIGKLKSRALTVELVKIVG